MSTSQLSSIPTNIITGFLGVGKTSAILHLLKNKPADERWAVLVNEFGEVGIDGGLFSLQHAEEQGVFVAEVPGGCMCCSAGLPMHIALTQLLRRAKPHRLLIEPSGLGHPKEVLQVLSSEYYQPVISLGPTLTLVDARNLTDERYTLNKTFQQQVAIADLVLAAKSDLYTGSDLDLLVDFVARWGLPTTDVEPIEHGRLPVDRLEGATASAITSNMQLVETQYGSDLVEASPIPECGYLEKVNTSSGFQSAGWRFSPVMTFNRIALIQLFKQLNVERLKAVVITDDGVFSYNRTRESLTEQMLDDCLETRIEVISDQLDIVPLRVALLQCVE